jgi:hypothetical protein
METDLAFVYKKAWKRLYRYYDDETEVGWEMRELMDEILDKAHTDTMTMSELI